MTAEEQAEVTEGNEGGEAELGEAKGPSKNLWDTTLAPTVTPSRHTAIKAAHAYPGRTDPFGECRERMGWVTIAVVFEVKKEIPDN